MQRRDFLSAAATTGLAAVAMSAKHTHASEAATSMADRVAKLDALAQKPLLNHAQAAKVMEQYDLAGMLAADPLNVFYLTNTWPVGVGMRKNLSAFATLPRNLDEPIFLVTTTLQSWDVQNRDRWVPEVIRYTSPRNWRDYEGDTSLALDVKPEATQRRPKVENEATLSPRETAWLEHGSSKEPAAMPEWALLRALRESGIHRGRVAVDDQRIVDRLKRIGAPPGITFVDGDNLFRRLRTIKSATEVEYLRIAGQNNQAAAVATASQLEAGMTLLDVEQRFMAEAGVRGNEVAFVLAGTSVGSFRQGQIVEGEPFLLDAVSHCRHYLGDFGRTVVVGEPSIEVRRRAAAQAAARDAVYTTLRPGASYSDLIRVGRDAFRKAGGPLNTFFVSPHSVGLQHTDQPYRDDSPFRMGEDLSLEVGMVITVDLPYIDLGFGAGHYEDLLLITADGFEPLHEQPDNLLIV